METDFSERSVSFFAQPVKPGLGDFYLGLVEWFVVIVECWFGNGGAGVSSFFVWLLALSVQSVALFAGSVSARCEPWKSVGSGAHRRYHPGARGC